MFRDFFKFLFLKTKAVQKCTAFFVVFLFCLQASSQTQRSSPEQAKLVLIRNQILSLISKKDRAEAVRIIDTALAQNTVAAEARPTLLRLKENILSIFLSQDSQNFFESSAAGMIQNIRLSEKNILSCLNLEADNLFCRWQHLKILKFKNDPRYTLLAQQFYLDTKSFEEFGALGETLIADGAQRMLLAQKNYPILALIHEFNQSVEAKNYSLSKDILNKIALEASDYPDLIYLRAQLSTLSNETTTEHGQRLLLSLYKKVCSSLSLELTRKYFYDMSLCQRSL
jgi:hypothetical protein